MSQIENLTDGHPMETLEYHFIDKSDWGNGPWFSEIDKKQWTDLATGLPCLIVRGPHGALCGYVGVPEAHPAFGRDYDNVDVRVHGGLTFARRCAEGDPERGICHKPAPGEPDHVWWLGFDCAHAGDYTPGDEAGYRKIITQEQWDDHERYLGLGRPTGWGGVIQYRDVAYVQAECAELAGQLAGLSL